MRQRIDNLFNFDKFLKKLPGFTHLLIDSHCLKLSATNTTQRRLSFIFQHLTHLGLLSLEFNLDQILSVLCLLKSSPNLERLDMSALPYKGIALESISTCLEAPDCLDEMLNL